MDQDLALAFDRARQANEKAVEALAPLAARMAVATVVDVLHGAHTLEVRGEVNEDWLPTLRIQRVLDAEGRVLFDVAHGHDDPSVEQAIDIADTEYLDLLIDLTGDEYMGDSTLT